MKNWKSQKLTQLPIVSENKIVMPHTTICVAKKHFDIGEQVLILMPHSTFSRLFSKWAGPATVVDVRSP